ncbi:amidase [Paenibacillus filicis]|uniref:Amidase n=1 Tax=Paenibacillus filicis TaxID=669464 RepID=A0ABU9DL25_9BACL
MEDEWKAYIKENLIIEPTGSGPLQGLHFAAKDVFAMAGHTNAAGNPDWFRTHHPAARHAEVVRRLLGSGAQLNGMTHTDELMFSLNGENAHYGTPVNPKAPGRIPGGSSSGSAVAVAAGLADFALGTDTGGSVRIPSSYCGIYGIRPTHGLVPMDGVIPLADSFDTVGWMARDAAMLLQVGKSLVPDCPESGEFQRLLFAQEAWEAAEQSCLQVLSGSVKLLESVMPSTWVSMAPNGLAEWVDTFRTIQGYEIWSNHGEWITRHQPQFGPGIKERFEWTSTLRSEDYERQSIVRKQIQTSLTGLLMDDGLLVIPTAPCPAPEIGLEGELMERTRSKVMQLSCIAGLSGLPQVTVPFTDMDGRPVGLSFIAGPRSDLRLLRFVRDVVAVLLAPLEAVRP